MAEQRRVFIAEDLYDEAQLARKVLHEYLESPSVDKERLNQVRVAQHVISTVAKLRQSDSALVAIQATIADRLASDTEDFQRYIRASMPSLPVVKAIPPPKSL